MTGVLGVNSPISENGDYTGLILIRKSDNRGNSPAVCAGLHVAGLMVRRHCFFYAVKYVCLRDSVRLLSLRKSIEIIYCIVYNVLY